MKKLYVTVKTLAACALLLGASSCGNKETAAPVAPATTDGQAAATINIRYIDADSVIGSYALAQQLMEEQQRELNKLQQWHENKQRELQGIANTISQKQQNNVYLSQASMQEDVNNLQKKSEEAERYFGTQQQRLAIAGEQMQRRLNDSINSFIKDYNAVHGYDAILLREAGVYFKPELNISAEVIEGLNARFAASQPAAK
ncbi:MAG: OmpH family outer membrane protein [Muribaculaceae bacterium]